MIKAIIIDDEQDSVEFINSIVDEYCPNVEIIGKAYSVADGTLLLKSEKPDLVFLDVEMPDGTGFNLLENFSEKDFNVIFITAFNHYALQAIKYSAIDYILKPINIKEFVEGVEKVNKFVKPENNISRSFSALMENLQASMPVKIAVSSSDGIEYIETNEIVRLRSDRSYSTIYLNEGREILVSKNLGEFQELLIGRNFFRAHNSHLINLMYVKKYIRSDGGYILMKDKTSIPVSKSKKELFHQMMSKLFK
jgi:two-component system, LytTR family, response regulator